MSAALATPRGIAIRRVVTANRPRIESCITPTPKKPPPDLQRYKARSQLRVRIEYYIHFVDRCCKRDTVTLTYAQSSLLAEFGGLDSISAVVAHLAAYALRIGSRRECEGGGQRAGGCRQDRDCTHSLITFGNKSDSYRHAGQGGGKRRSLGRRRHSCSGRWGA